MDYSNIVQTILIYALPVLFAITVHEAAHGYVARYFGDDTAYMMGRVTLNPLKHIDPFGTILLPVILFFSTMAIPGGPYPLGYAKPVPVQFGRLRHPKRDMIWVAAAGPVSNFIQALAWGVLLIVLGSMGVQEPFFLQMARAGIAVNLVIGVFNLFPLPPLDGGRVLVGLLPWKAAHAVGRIEPFGFFIVLALLIAQVIDQWWIRPLVGAGYAILQIILKPLAMLLS